MKYCYLPLALLCVACSLESDEIEVESRLSNIDGAVSTVYGTVPEYIFDDGSKVSISTGGKFSWRVGDKLGFWPDSSIVPYGEPGQLIFDVVQGGTSQAVFRGNGWGLIKGQTYYAYYPYDTDAIYNSVKVDYEGQVQQVNNDASHIGAFDYLAARLVVPKDSDCAYIKFEHLGSLLKFVITVPTEYENAHFSKVMFDYYGDENCFVCNGNYVPTSSEPVKSFVPAESYSSSYDVGLNNITAENRVVTIFIMMAPYIKKDMEMTLYLVSDKGTLEGDFKISRDFVAGGAYCYSIDVEKSIPEGCVDMGLDVYWRNKPIGGYYALGESQTKSDYSKNTYTANLQNKYSPGQVLSWKDDTATKLYGRRWRIPTKEEFQKLKYNSTFLNGYFISTVSGYTDKQIYFPEKGCKQGTTYIGGYGYWLSDIGSESSETCGTEVFKVYYESGFREGSMPMYYGCTIIPVCDK